MHCLTSKTLKCNSFILKICMFLQKDTSHCKSSLALGLQGLRQDIFCDHIYSINVRKLRFHVFLLFHVRKHMAPFYLKWTEFTTDCEFYSNFGSPETHTKLERTHDFWWIRYTSGKVIILYVFSIKMEKYMESELSDIFWVKMVTKNKVFGSTRTYFMHMRVNVIILDV